MLFWPSYRYITIIPRDRARIRPIVIGGHLIDVICLDAQDVVSLLQPTRHEQRDRVLLAEQERGCTAECRRMRPDVGESREHLAPRHVNEFLPVLRVKSAQDAVERAGMICLHESGRRIQHLGELGYTKRFAEKPAPVLMCRSFRDQEPVKRSATKWHVLTLASLWAVCPCWGWCGPGVRYA